MELRKGNQTKTQLDEGRIGNKRGYDDTHQKTVLVKEYM
jgi:hypothetical protein